MPSACIVRGCRSVHWKGTSLRFHQIPKQEKKKKQWLEICGVTKNIECGVVCSRHFESSAFQRNLKYELLGLPLPPSQTRFKPGTVPTLHLQHEEGKWHYYIINITQK